MRPSLPGVSGTRPVVRTLEQAKFPSLLNFIAACLTMSGAATLQVSAQTKVPSTTAFAITVNGQSATTVAGGTSVTMTATVTATSTGTNVTAGAVFFCDASAAFCSDIHVIGSATLTSGGTASIQVIPAPGDHTYKAYFTGSATTTTTGSSTTESFVAVSTSSPLSLNVTAPTTTSITETGSLGNYTLTASVTSQGTLGVPTGSVAFLDTSNGGATVGTATLGPGNTGALTWVNSQSPAVYGGAAIIPAPVPQSVAVGDFNGDGIPDLVVGSTGFLSILLGNGDGTFQSPRSIPAFASNKYLAVGNFVAGGPLDVLVASDVADSNPAGANTIPNIQLFLGDGKGGLTAQTAFTNGVGTLTGLAAGYLNASGNLGFVVAGTIFGAFTLDSYNGEGSGTFDGGTLEPVGGTSAGPVVVEDFTGDGAPDLVEVNASGINAFQNNGSGDFTPSAGYSSAINSPTSVVAADFNGDGKLDLAVTNSTTASVTVYQGNGAGAFTLLSSTATGSTPASASVGDFNGDGIPDLAVANTGDNTVSLLIGDGDGNFTATTPISVGSAPVSVAAADFSNVGITGFITANSGAVTATVELPHLSHSATATANPILTDGTHLIDASYAGSISYTSSISSTISLNGQAVSTQLTLTANPTTAAPGQQVVLSATLSPYNSDTATTNTETITFYSGATSLGAASLASGVATLNTTSLSTSSDSLTAKYAGDTNFNLSTSSPINVTVTAPAVGLSPMSLTFGSQTTNTTSTAQTVTLTNMGSVPLSITAIAASAPFFETNTCGNSVSAAATCTISVTFSPTNAGTLTGAVTIQDNGAGSLQTISLSGTATDPIPAASLSPTSLTFTAQPVGSTSADQTVIVTNTGSAPLTISAVTASTNFGETNTCGSNIAAAGNCTISVTFVPTAAGTVTGTLTVADNAPGSPQIITLIGTGTAVAIGTSVTSLNISSPGSSATAALSITSASGFTGPISLACKITYQDTGTLTDAPTCSLSPFQGQVTPTTPLTSTLSIATTGNGTPTAFNRMNLPAGGALAALVLLCVLPRRRWKNAMLLLLLTIATAGIATGCGSMPHTTIGNYQVTITATSATLTVTTTIPLTVQ